MNKTFFNFEPGEESRGDSYSVKYDVELFSRKFSKSKMCNSQTTLHSEQITFYHLTHHDFKLHHPTLPNHLQTRF